jgi:two-component system LytT family sensor kinase
MRIYNFIFSDKIAFRILRHISFWVAWYMYEVMLFLYNNSNVQNTFWLTLKVRCLKLLVISPIGIIQCYIIVYWLIPVFLLQKKYMAFICGVIISSVTVIFFVALLTYKKFDFLSTWVGIASYISRGVPIPLVFIMIKMLKTWYLKEKEKDTLIKENANAELQLLKAQVHPHFLFNTLNNIYFFILTNTKKAQGLVKKLEKILQYMITECDQPVVPLSREIDLINDYFELEKVRYDDLDIELKITGDCTNKMIAPLLMIPFIENSFKHGTSKMLRDPWIKLFIQADDEILHFSLTNNKPNETIVNKKNGIGLSNVKKRLELLYAKEHYLLIEPTINTFTVNMQIPLTHIN